MSYSPSLEFPISIRHSCHENMFTYFVSIFLSHDYATSNFNDFHTSSNPSKRSNLVTNTILWCYSNYYIAFFYNLFFLYNLRNNVYVFLFNLHALYVMCRVHQCYVRVYLLIQVTFCYCSPTNTKRWWWRWRWGYTYILFSFN